MPDLEKGLALYSDKLGHQLVWRTDKAIGLAMPGSEAEIVLQTERDEPETDILVDSVDAAVSSIEEAGGKVIVPPFDIRIGRCAIVADPWSNRMVLVDSTKGLLATDREGNVVGNRAVPDDSDG